MKATLTSIKLRGPFKFFLLSATAMKIIQQLKATNCRDFKKRGVWTTHYTMTLWDNEQDLKNFAYSGAHKEAMKLSAKLAKEIKTLTLDADALPPWKEAIKLLNSVEPIKY